MSGFAGELMALDPAHRAQLASLLIDGLYDSCRHGDSLGVGEDIAGLLEDLNWHELPEVSC